MQQLTPLDSVFLSLETSEIPSHIGGLAILDPSTHPEEAFDYDVFVDFVAERLPLCPRFAWRLQQVPFGLDQPYWLEEEELDLSLHVRRMAVPSPGTMNDLTELAGYLFGGTLDRSRPLWEMYYIEGLQGGRKALLWKVHHCLMDGVSGAGLIEMLFDLQPVPGDRPLIEVDDTAIAGKPVGLASMATRALSNAVQRPVAMARHAMSIGEQVIDTVRTDGLDGLATAPQTPFNGVVGSQRSVAAVRVSLERVKNLKNDLGVTVNDVVLTLTSEAVRRYLDRRDALPEESLVAGVPVSVREKGDKSMGNKISEMGITWATNVECMLERVRVINEDSTRAKSSAKAKRVNPVAVMAESLLPGAMQLLARASTLGAESMPLPANAVVSNVPMSPVPIYLAGAKIEGMVPMSMLAPTQGFNITVLSYCGELHFGLIADPNLVDNVAEIADGISKAMMELEEAVDRDLSIPG
jgi:WS/DGAT/MGAT family acyltransferase